MHERETLDRSDRDARDRRHSPTLRARLDLHVVAFQLNKAQCCGADHHAKYASSSRLDFDLVPL
jgi:hypothetical protein